MAERWEDGTRVEEPVVPRTIGLLPEVVAATRPDLDTSSSASVQHYIETGRYLTWQEQLEDLRAEVVELLALKIEVMKLALGSRAVTPLELARLVAVKR